MFKKDNWFIGGWVYLVVMFILEMVLPPWMGDENGPIENLQMLWLIAGWYYCWKMRSADFRQWGGSVQSLSKAGMIYFFLLIMREISWGRALLTHPDGSHYEYSEMGVLGADGASDGCCFNCNIAFMSVAGKGMALFADGKDSCQKLFAAADFYFYVLAW